MSTVSDRARFCISDHILQYQVLQDLSMRGTGDIAKLMSEFAEKESLDRAIEELERIEECALLNFDGSTLKDIDKRIAELKAMQRGVKG